MKVCLNWTGDDGDSYYTGVPNTFCGVKGHKNIKVYDTYDDADRLTDDIDFLLQHKYSPLQVEEF